MLTGKVALITGAGSGIGRCVAVELAEAGATVIINDYLEELAEKTTKEILARNKKAFSLVFDVSNYSEVSKKVKEILKETPIHILVNNAGITRDALFVRMKEEDWDRVMAINLKGMFNCTQAVIRSMIKEGWGRIINISSVIGLMGNAGQANYAAAKAGVIGFTKSIAKEFAHKGITANAVAPGFIDTPMTKNLSENIKQEYIKIIPMGRFGLPEDISGLVIFLASEKASYITGQVINVDGGMLM